MIKQISISLLSTLFTVKFASAQDIDSMLQQELQKSAAMTEQMQQMQNGIVNQNMQNPQVQAMYQNYLASGGTMSLQDFAYQYAATGGFSERGKQIYNDTTRNIQQRDQAALDDYRQNQQQNNQAINDMRWDSEDRTARARGNLLNGTTDYVDPNTGQTYNLPHTAPGGSQYYDPNSGDYFNNDDNGNYYRQDSEGYSNELEEAE